MTAASVAQVPQGAVLRERQSRQASAGSDFLVGQMLNIKVQQQIDEHHYVVLVRGEARRVSASQPLPAGKNIDVVVVRTEDQLELRQVGGRTDLREQPDSALEELAPADYSNMQEVAVFYQCAFSPEELALLQDAVNQSAQPESVALAGLWLNRQGITLQPALLQSMVSIQTFREPLNVAAASASTAENAGKMPTVTEFAEKIRQVTSVTMPLSSDVPADAGMDSEESLGIATSATPQLEMLLSAIGAASADDRQRDPRFSQQLMHWMNDADADADGMGIRYGTLPVLINGQLVELEMMLFQHRPNQANVEPVRRLTMSIQTSTLGRVHVMAEGLHDRLLINISGETAEQTEVLSAYADEVKELAKRFGWSLDSVGYEVRAQGGRLVQKVMEHNVRQGMVDYVW